MDVIVTDGFTGNILLKGCEGMIKFLMGQLKGVFLSSTKNKLAALMLKSDFAKLKDMMDVNKIGGTALLGISKPVIKAHGSSNDEAVFSAIRQAVRFAQAGVIEEIENNIEYMRLATGETEKRRYDNMIYEKILKLVAEQFAEEEESLSRDTNFMDDLNADSLDVVELSMTIEEEFGLGEISEDELRSIETIGDLVDYVEKAAGN